MDLINKFEADHGCTSMVPPLQVSIEKIGDQYHSNKQIFLLTDGQADEGSYAVKNTAFKSKDICSIHTLGIGNDCDSQLV